MDWNRILRLDLGGLLRGKVDIHAPAPNRSFYFPLRARVRSLVTGPSSDLAQMTFNLSQAVACNAPLVPAIDAMMDDNIPTYRLYNALRRLRGSLNAGMTLSEAMRRQPRFFPPYYADLVKAGERTGTLLSSFQEAGELCQQRRVVGLAILSGTLYVGFVTFVAGLIITFIAAKIAPVFSEILHDFESEPPTPIFGWMDRLLDSVARVFHASSWSGLEKVIGIAAFFVALLLLLRWLLRSGALVRILRVVPGLAPLFAKARCAFTAGVLGRLLSAGYPLDEALDSVALGASPRRWRVQLERLRDAVRRGLPFHEAIAAEGRRLPHSFRDLVFVGETSGRLPEMLKEASHFYREQVARTSYVLSRIAFCAVIVGLGCLVYQVYAGTFLMYISLVDVLMDSL